MAQKGSFALHGHAHNGFVDRLAAHRHQRFDLPGVELRVIRDWDVDDQQVPLGDGTGAPAPPQRRPATVPERSPRRHC